MTNTAKHTPGPWYYDGERQIRTDQDICIALVHEDNAHPVSEYVDPLPQKANARLIAAAPELLEALKKVERQMKAGCMPEVPGAVFAQVRAAIAKATQA